MTNAAPQVYHGGRCGLSSPHANPATARNKARRCLHQGEEAEMPDSPPQHLSFVLVPPLTNILPPVCPALLFPSLPAAPAISLFLPQLT